MALAKKPVTGMKDIMPEEMRLREYVMGIIRKTYASYGFTQIETPCMENIGNLSSKQGGENEKLIFKILKRGEKLHLDTAKTENDVVDFGMRYDLTVPLCRYYANHANDLPSPFKALQMGNVWRADRPQRGRFRQFMQCDIDILGEPSNLAEIELILATTETLGRIGFSGFEIRINERRILKAMAAGCGFAEEDFDSIFIILDKMDKIGAEGVRDELLQAGYPAEAVEKYLGLFELLAEAGQKTGEGSLKEGVRIAGADAIRQALDRLADRLKDALPAEVTDWLMEIIATVEAAKKADFQMVFDPTLVRGMSYYTGTIFEIAIPEFGGSCGGGGRYDKMVGNFTGKDVPACGFSIGFERIVLLLMEQGFEIPNAAKKKAYLLEKGYSSDQLKEVMEQAQAEREAGMQVLVARMNKNKKFQKDQLAAQGYEDVKEIYRR